MSTDIVYCRECWLAFRESQLLPKAGRRLIPTHGADGPGGCWRPCPGGKRLPALPEPDESVEADFV